MLNGSERKVMELLLRGIAPKEFDDFFAKPSGRRSCHYYLRRAKDKLGARTTYQACAIFARLNPEVSIKTDPNVEDLPHLEKAIDPANHSPRPEGDPVERSGSGQDPQHSDPDRGGS